MQILLCNDDGIHAPGLAVLAGAVRDLGEIHIVAPDSEQSAVGHAITIANPIKTKTVLQNGRFWGHSVLGTPADCVKLALAEILDSPPDLIISGVNLGPNAGIAVIYSGTVSAATEGTILGIPSIAISLATFRDPQWETAARVAHLAAERVLREGLPPDTLLNINIPNLLFDDIPGFAVTRMARSRFAERFHRRTNPRGDLYYWLDGDLELLEPPDGTDIQALENGFISLTPIGYDLTQRTAMPRFESWTLSSRSNSTGLEP